MGGDRSKGKERILSIVAFGVRHVYTMIESHRLG